MVADVKIFANFDFKKMTDFSQNVRLLGKCQNLKIPKMPNKKLMPWLTWKLNLPPKICIPRRAKISRNKNNRKISETIDLSTVKIFGQLDDFQTSAVKSEKSPGYRI